MMELKQSPVTFTDNPHSYHLDGRELKGVTTMMEKMLFPDKYKGVPQANLDRAASYGTMVHKAVETFNCLDYVEPEYRSEVDNYYTLCQETGLTHVQSEYLVSDEKTVASKVDCVFINKKGEIVLADLKTTSGGLDKEYLQWQLSIYAYLFELQNPGLKVKGLYGIWLRHDECKIEQYPRLKSDAVAALIDDYALYLKDGLALTSANNVPASIKTLSDELRLIAAEKEDAEARYEEMRERLKAAMVEHGLLKIKMEGMTVTYIAPTVTRRLDSQALKAAKPELYELYCKSSSVSDSIKISIK